MICLRQHIYINKLGPSVVDWLNIFNLQLRLLVLNKT